MKKGFTLIELLAVILILGIIALIAIPTVNNIINESKKGAFNSTANNLVRTLEEKCQIEKMKGNTITKQYLFSKDGSYPKINIKGQLPTSGIAYIDNECNVAISIANEKYVIEKQINVDEYTTKENEDANYQIKKFYFDGTKKLYLYKVPEEPFTQEDKQEMVNDYGQELADLLCLIDGFQAYALYVNENDEAIKWYLGYSFPKTVGMDKINRFRMIIKEHPDFKDNFIGENFVITTNNEIFVMFNDYSITCMECMTGSASEITSQLRSTINSYGGIEIVIE